MQKHEMYALLKTAADKCDAAASDVDDADKAVNDAKAEANEAKKASTEAQTKTASEATDEVEIARLAKTAAAKVHEVGLLSNEAQTDQFASQIRDPRVALQKLAELAGHVTAPKLGTVVKQASTSTTPSADEVYEARARKLLPTIGG